MLINYLLTGMILQVGGAHSQTWITLKDKISFNVEMRLLKVKTSTSIWSLGIKTSRFDMIWFDDSMTAVVTYLCRRIATHTLSESSGLVHLNKKVHGSHLDYESSRLHEKIRHDTVDGRNPAPPGMYETLQIMGYLSYQLVQDFFHQQYDKSHFK